VTKFEIGDRVGVGCFVSSCGTCRECKNNLDNHCHKMIFTYNAVWPDGTVQQGGYSDHIDVRADHVLRLPDTIPMAQAAPLLCAGITMYSPIKTYGLDKPGLKIGVLGLGGLGHMAVKLVAAMGGKPYVLTRSAGKVEDAKRLGAEGVILTSDEASMKSMENQLDAILDTVSAAHQVTTYANLIRVGGKYVVVGVPDEAYTIPPTLLIFKRLTLAGSLIGGIQETQEMLDFCGKHKVGSDVEVIPASYVNEAFERMLASDVKYRFVIDVQGSLAHPGPQASG